MSEFNIDQLLPGAESQLEQTPTTPQDDGIDLEIAPGKTERFTKAQLADFYKGHLRQDDYTRKTQELATQRKQFEQALPQIERLYQEHQALVQLIEDKDKLTKWMQTRFQQQGQEPSSQEVQAVKQQEQKIAALMQHIQKLEGRMQQQGQEFVTQTRAEIETAQLSEKVDAHLQGIFKDMPALSAIDNVEDILRFKVFNRNPQTLDEAKQFFSEEAKGLVEKVKKAFGVQVQAPPQGGGAPRGIEPPGGAGSAPPQKPSYKGKDGRVDFNKVGDAADEFLRNWNANQR